HARSGITAIEPIAGFGERARAVRANDVVDVPARADRARDVRAERPDDPRRRAHVGAVTGAGDPGLAAREEREHQRPVADRLVAGQAELAGQLPGWPDLGGGTWRGHGAQCRDSPSPLPDGSKRPRAPGSPPSWRWRTCSCTGSRSRISDAK